MNHIALFEKSISAIETRCKVKKYFYEPNKFLQSTLECCDDIGTIKDEGDALGDSFCKKSTEKTDLYKSAFQSIGPRGIAGDFNELRTESVNIAVVGCTGVGKSTFINSMCEYEIGDISSAQTGVTNTTSAVIPYRLRRNKDVVLWDFPGFDSNQIHSEQYFEMIDFETMDFFLIILSTRITEKDARLIKYVEQHSKQYYLLRSKFDCDLENARMQNCSNEHVETVLRTKLKSSFKNAIKDFKYVHDIFVIDNFVLKNHDYENLEKAMISDAAHVSAEKSMSLTFALPIITEYAQAEKRRLFERRLAKKALQATTCLPSSKSIAQSLKEEEDFYKHQFSRLSDIKITSNEDLSQITNDLRDLKRTLIHKRVDMAKDDLFKEKDKIVESIYPFFDIIETYELCWIWLKQCLERTLKSS